MGFAFDSIDGASDTTSCLIPFIDEESSGYHS